MFALLYFYNDLINIPTKQAYSYNLNSINNIKEEEIKIKETKPASKEIKLLINNSKNNSNSTLAEAAELNNINENIDKSDKKVDVLKDNVEKINMEIADNIKHKFNNSPINMLSASASNSTTTITGKKAKDNDKKNNMLHHLIHLHKFRI